MPSVVFWPGVAGGTGQYRCKTPGEALRRRGWDVSYVEDDSEPVDADVFVLGRVISPIIADLIDELHARSKTFVVYDIDDWFDRVPEYNPAHETELSHLHAAMERADLITVSTPGLAKLYGRFGPVQVLPNLLDPYYWRDNDQYRTPHEGIHLGWLAAYKWRGGDIEVLRPWLPRFLSDHPEVTFGALGCPELLEDLGINGFSLPMAPYAHLPKMLGGMDIALVPLTYNVFNWAGKSWIKAMESNAMGIPAVASPSEANRAYIRPGINGLLVRKNNWAAQVEAVMADLENYRRGSLKVADEHFIDDWIWKWEAAYSAGRHQ